MFKFLGLSLLLSGCLAAPETSPTTPIYRPNEITFVVSAKNIAGDVTDNDGVADPFVKVFTARKSSAENSNVTELALLDVSETIVNENNPHWSKVFRIQHTPGTHQILILEVRDHDPANPDDSIGEAIINVDDFVAKNTQTKMLAKANSGSVTVVRTTPIMLDLIVKDIPHLDEFGSSSDPYIKCYFRVGEGGKDWKFHQTSTKDNADTASWLEIPYENYQKGTNQWFHFLVKDEDSVTGDDDLGEIFLEIDPFLAAGKPVTMRLSDKENGTLTVGVHKKD